MKTTIALILMVVSFSLTAQEIDSLTNDTLPDQIAQDSLDTPGVFWGVFGEITYGVSPSSEGYTMENRLALGVSYKKWSVGFQRSVFKGTIEKRLIFPNNFRLDYERGGPFVMYRLYESKWVNGSVRASFEKGDMVWERSDTKQDFLRDEFNLYTVGIDVESSYIKYLKPFLHVGYQQMSGLKLSNVKNLDFSGFFFSAGLKIGYFNQ